MKGNVSRSMPAGAVQLLPEDEEDGKKIKKEDAAPQNGPQDQNPGKMPLRRSSASNRGS